MSVPHKTQEGKAAVSRAIGAKTAAQREAATSPCPPSVVCTRWTEPSAWGHREGDKVPSEATWQGQ